MAATKNIAEKSLDFLKAYWMPIAGCVGAYLLYNKFFVKEKEKEVDLNYGIPSVDPNTGQQIATISDEQAYAYAYKLYKAMKGLGTTYSELEAVYNSVKSDIFAVRKVYNAFNQVLKDYGESGDLKEWLSDEYFFGGNYKIEENWYALLTAAGI
jgi:hypothetical protein